MLNKKRSKQQIKNDKFLMQMHPHHRRPLSIGGKNVRSNISMVRRDHHDAWNILVGNKNAFQICDFLNVVKYKSKNIKIVCKFINGVQVTKTGTNNSKNEDKISFAWFVLFNGLSFIEIINNINNIWLDPSYHLYIEEV